MPTANAMIQAAREGICPRCHGPAIPCSPKRVHPKARDDAEAYRCIRCSWCALVWNTTAIYQAGTMSCDMPIEPGAA